MNCHIPTLRSVLPLLLPALLLVVCASSGCASYANQPRAERSYFGQLLPGEEAVLFAPDIVSIEGRFEYALSVSPEGDEILFSAESPGVPATLYHSRLKKGEWTPPVRVSLSRGAKKSEMEAFFTPDGKRIHFAPFDEGMDVRIWTVDRGPDGWAAPREMSSPLADDPAFFPTAALNGVIYYSNLAARKIYRAVVEGDVVASVEDAGLGIGMHAFIAPDESFVLLDGRKDEMDSSDIYVAFRNEDGSWTDPAALGPEVNTEHDETCPTLSHDGRYIFFSRYNEENEISNIYWISSEVIEQAKAAAFLSVPTS
jgi:Tol biopolymer transport system component